MLGYIFQALEGIQTSLELLKKELLTGNLSPINRLYRSLNCELTELDSTETDYKVFYGEKVLAVCSLAK